MLLLEFGSDRLDGNKIKKVNKNDSSTLLLIGVGAINIIATLYTCWNPKLEEKLFSLYLASVSGLYGGLTIQNFQRDRSAIDRATDAENIEQKDIQNDPIAKRFQKKNKSSNSEFRDGNF